MLFLNVFFNMLKVIYKNYTLLRELAEWFPTWEELEATYIFWKESYRDFIIAYNENYERAARIMGRDNLEATITLGGLVLWYFIMLWVSDLG